MFSLADHARDRYRDQVVAKAIKVCLENRGEDRETPWATDLGPAPGPKGSRKVRLANVPFMHAKPTWGDVIVVSPIKGTFPTWDRDGVAWSKIDSRIIEDGGRWAMIVSYAPKQLEAADDCFDALCQACAELEVVCEGATEPRAGRAGHAYLAVKYATTDKAVMNHLGRAGIPCDLVQIHPTPAKPAKAVKRPVKKKRAVVRR